MAPTPPALPIGDNRAMLAPTPPQADTPRGRRAEWLLAVALTATTLPGCDMLGIDTPAKQAERREAEGKAIGAACRHTQRSLEDCYASNPKASKAAIFAGWREMDEYMRENDIPPATPTARPAPPAEPKEEVVDAGDGAPGPQAEGKAAPAGGTAAPAAANANGTTAATAAPAGAKPPTGSIVPNLAPAAQKTPPRQ